MTKTSGTFYRISLAQYADKVLDGAIHPEGRFHHTGQPALYASPTEAGAAVAIKIYTKPDDPDRVVTSLDIRDASLADLRNPETCNQLGIDPKWPSVSWADQRAAGEPAMSWRASDAARADGADGMLYASRRAPETWHIVLFRWNVPDGPTVRVAGPQRPWISA